MTFIKGYWNLIRLCRKWACHSSITQRNIAFVGHAFVQLIAYHAKVTTNIFSTRALLRTSHLSFPVCVGCPGHQDGGGWLGRGLVGAVGVLWPLQLHLEPFHADLEAVHWLDGSLGTTWVVEAHKPWGKGQKRARKWDKVRRRGKNSLRLQKNT